MPEVLPGVLGVVAEFLLDTEKLEEGKQQLVSARLNLLFNIVPSAEKKTRVSQLRCRGKENCWSFLA